MPQGGSSSVKTCAMTLSDPQDDIAVFGGTPDRHYYAGGDLDRVRSIADLRAART